MLRTGIYYFWTQSQRVRAREFETGPSAAFTSNLKVGMIMPSIQQVLIVILIRIRIGLFVINICIFQFKNKRQIKNFINKSYENENLCPHRIR